MDELLAETLLSTERLYTGKIINLRVDRVSLAGGGEATREVVEHPGAVAIVALTEQGEILLVQQYRRPADRILLEIPAGKLEKGERPEDCARRELAEETGFSAAIWEKKGEFFTAPGFTDELIHLFLARQLVPMVANPDEDEIVQVSTLPLAKAWEMVQQGQFADAKTIAGICLCYQG